MAPNPKTGLKYQPSNAEVVGSNNVSCGMWAVGWIWLIERGFHYGHPNSIV